jgi:hypothetical protein
MDRKVVGAVVAAAALVAGGCGSSSKPLTRAEFVQRAEVACRHAQQIVNRRSSTTTRGPEAFIERIVAGMKAESDELGKLTPPKGMQATFAAYKQDLAQFSALAQRYGAAAKARDDKQMQAINREATPMTARRAAHMRSLGLRSCT